MHPVLRYVRSEGITQREFARRVGVSPQLVTDVLKGRTRFGTDTAFRIEERTGGELDARQLLSWGRKARAA